MQAARAAIAEILSERASSRPAAVYRLLEIVVVATGIVAMMLATTDLVDARQREVALDLVAGGVACLSLDWLVRLWAAPSLLPQLSGRQARLRWLRTPSAVLGLAAILPMLMAAPFDWSVRGAPLLAALWVLRFAPYSRGTTMLFDVLVREREAVLGVLFAFASFLLFGSVVAYLFEHERQPERFGSVPAALWWAIVTLTTTGYGDAVPVTLFGRMMAGVLMMAGIIMFGLLAGILATGFSQEVRRREFLRNWDLVKQVPMFHDIGPGTVADLAALLRPRELPPRAVLWRRGDVGDAMYFIVSGEVMILIEPPLRLGAGNFFGELALLNDRPRNATVVTTQSCQLLELDIADFRALASKTPELMRSIEHEAARRLEVERKGSA
jgi:voltage-gated potassium channel